MSWTWLRDEEVIARKEHRCTLCGETICKGEKYSKRTGTDDGIITMKMHMECEKESSTWSQEDWECSIAYEMERPKILSYLGLMAELENNESI